MEKKINPTRVMHVIDSLAPGGAERVLVELVRGLHHQGVAVSVCVSRSDVSLACELPPSVDLLVLNRLHTWDWAAIRRLVRYCQKQQITILHAHGRSTTRLCALAKLLSAGRLRLVFHDHFGDIHVDDQVTLSLKGLGRGLVDFYIGVDEMLQEWAVKKLGIKENCTMTLGNVIDLDRFSQDGFPNPALPSTPYPLRAAIVANLKPQKDHPLLFQALASTALAKKNLSILVVGAGVQDDYERHCYQLVDKLGLRDNITFLGSRGDVPQILKQVDFGLLSSRSESGPLTLLEYMASRLPFLVTDTGQVSKKVCQSGLSYFVPAGNIEAYSRALDQLTLMSVTDRTELGLKGHLLVKHVFSLFENVTKLVRVYEHISM